MDSKESVDAAIRVGRRVCILIGFKYDKGSEDRPTLPGIVVDLYQAYTSAMTMNPDRIVVVTDVTEDRKTKELMTPMIKGYVGSGVLSFISDIRERDQYVKYGSVSSLKLLIKEISTNANEVFLYYTGHGLNGKVLLPVGSIDMSLLRSMVERSSSDSARILLVVDCCYGDGMKLPYVLRGKVYRLDKGDRQFTRKNILYLCSTSSRQGAITTSAGSIFSRSLFKHINNQSSLCDLVEKINEDCRVDSNQQAMVYASHPNIKKLWTWTRGTSVEVFFFRNSVVVEKL